MVEIVSQSDVELLPETPRIPIVISFSVLTLICFITKTIQLVHIATAMLTLPS